MHDCAAQITHEMNSAASASTSGQGPQAPPSAASADMAAVLHPTDMEVEVEDSLLIDHEAPAELVSHFADLRVDAFACHSERPQTYRNQQIGDRTSQLRVGAAAKKKFAMPTKQVKGVNDDGCIYDESASSFLTIGELRANHRPHSHLGGPLTTKQA